MNCPPKDTESLQKAFLELVAVVAQLRNPAGGCPWDLEQTHESLKPFLIEETYEAIAAIDEGPDKLKVELGDVLLQVVLHSQLASEKGEFTIREVIEHITQKLIYRHPHVFADTAVDSAAQVLQNWEQLKKRDLEKGQSILDGVPANMPALLRAQRIGEKAARVGFDWVRTDDVKQKVLEEVNEFLECAADKEEPDRRMKAEFGDLLFALAQLARKLDLDSENILQGATDKFSRRFKELEKRAPGLETRSASELDKIWEEIKAEEKSEDVA